MPLSEPRPKDGQPAKWMESMGHDDADRPSQKDITEREQTGDSRRLRLAIRRLYADGKTFHFLGHFISLGFAIAGPIVASLQPAAGATLGAAAGLWIFVSRLLFLPHRDKNLRRGAVAQEIFDCNILGLPWNPGVGESLAPEEIRRAARRAAKKPKWAPTSWYPTSSDAPWPRSVLISQRSNAVWARRQHVMYSWVMIGLAVFLGALGIVLSIGEPLATYLASVGLPSLPALLDAIEEGRAHSRHSQSRERMERALDQALKNPDISVADLRAFQDWLFRLRLEAPLVPDWFYERIRGGLEQDMEEAAADLSKEV